MKNENYITIQGWMVNELKLKGNELIVFALIYGFCQDGDSEFRGSLKYISESLQLSRSGVIKILKSLVKNGFLTKKEEVITNITFNRYSIGQVVQKILNGGTQSTPCGGAKSTPGGTQSTPGGGAQSERGGGTQSTPNNTILDNTNYNNIDIKEKIYKKENCKIEKEKIEESVENIYKKYPTKCKVNTNRSLGKCTNNKDQIRKLLKTHTEEELIKIIEWYINDRVNSNTYFQNFKTFLNNLPEIPEEQSEPKRIVPKQTLEKKVVPRSNGYYGQNS